MKKNIKKFKRFIAILLTLTLLIGSIPMTEWRVMAEQAESDKEMENNQELFTGFSGGDGSKENPYQISSSEMFREMENYPGQYFVLNSDLDLSDSPRIDFEGTFDGNGHTIETGFSQENGMFNNLGETAVITDCNVYIGYSHLSSLPSNMQKFGAVAICNQGVIKRCVVKGKIIINYVDSLYSIGSICEINAGHVEKCRNDADYSFMVQNPGHEVSIVGICGGSGTVTQCLNTGNLSVGVDIGIPGLGIWGNYVAGINRFAWEQNISECANIGNITLNFYSELTNSGMVHSYAGFIYDSEFDAYGSIVPKKMSGIESCYIGEDVEFSFSTHNLGTYGGVNSKSIVLYANDVTGTQIKTEDEILEWWDSILVDDENADDETWVPDGAFSISKSGAWVAGKECALYGSYSASTQGNALKEAEEIVWSSSDSSIIDVSEAEINFDITSSDNNRVSIQRSFMAKTAGTVTITATAPDGRSASITVDVEPELVAVGTDEKLTEEMEITLCQMTLEESDKDFLESVMSKINVEVASNSNNVFEIIDGYYEIAEDGLSAKFVYVLSPVSSGSTTFQISTFGGQKIEIIVRSGLQNESDGFFVIPDDEWKFKNYGVDSIPLTEEDYNALMYACGDNEASKEVWNSKINPELPWYKYLWEKISKGHIINGQCYGMALSALLVKNNLLSLNSIQDNISSLYEAEKNENSMSVIGWYQIAQYLVRDSIIKDFEQWSTEKQLNTISNFNNCFLLVFGAKNWGEHAVVGYAIEKGKWEYHGRTYDRRVLTYDSNTVYNNSNIEEYYLYFNDGTDDWEIPHYYSGGVSSEKTGYLVLAYENVEDLNMDIEKWREEFRENRTTLTTSNLNINLDIEKESFMLSGGKYSGEDYYAYYEIGYNESSDNYSPKTIVEFDDISSFTISSGKNDILDYSLLFGDYYLQALSENFETVYFSDTGEISITGLENEVGIALTANDDVLPWDTVSILNDGASRLSMEQTNDGILVESDNLNDVIVYATNDGENKELPFSADEESILITESDNELIVLIDTDNDGVYDTDVNEKEENIHEYGTPEFVWSKDYTTCTAVFTCESCDDEQKIECDIISETMDPTCTKDGKTVYTAMASFAGKEYTDTQEGVITATGHIYEYTDDGDGTHTKACSSCDISEAEVHTYEEGTCKYCKAEEPKEHSHSYSSPEFEWSEDYQSCTAVFTCKDGDDVQRIDCEVTSEITDATCTEDGKTVYAATVNFAGATFTDEQTEIINATGHTYNKAEFEWSEDYQSCMAVINCKDGDDVKRIDCEVTSETTDATCTEDGTTVYTATVSFEGEVYTDTKKEAIPAGGHTYKYVDNGDDTHTKTCTVCDTRETENHTYEDGICKYCKAEEPKVHSHEYGKPKFEWSKDYQSCTAIFSCKNGDDEQRIECEVSSKTTDPTCTEDGKTIYTATVSFGGAEFTDTKEESIPSTGHIYEYADNGDGTHTKTCTICDASESEPHTYVDGICQYCKAEEPEEHSHEYGKPKFEWSKDNENCAAVFICKDGDDKQQVECKVTSKILTEATCTEDGTVAYSATANFEGQEYTDTKEATIPATGHTYKYMDNGDGTHTKTCTVCDTSETEKHIYEDSICQYCKAEEPKEHSHEYGKPKFEWSKDNKSCTAVFTCKDGDDEQRVECEVTSKTTDPTCTEDGKTVYTATVSFGGAEFTDTQEESIPSAGHTYEYTDNGDGTHTKRCTICDASESELHTYEDGTCKYCKAEEPEEHSHEYGKPKFEWSKDNKRCTAVFTCKDGDDEQRIECEVSSKTTDATCTKDGKIVYKATVSFGGEEYTDTKEKKIEATGHTYEYQDNGDGTHKKVCTSCGKSITESHNYQKGVCKQCGAEQPNDNHHNDFWYYDFGKGIRRFLEKIVIPFWENLFQIF